MIPHDEITFDADKNEVGISIFENVISKFTDQPIPLFMEALCQFFPVKHVYVEFKGEDEWFDVGNYELRNKELVKVERIPGKSEKVQTLN